MCPVCFSGMANRGWRFCDRRIHRNPATLVTPASFDICVSMCT